MSRPKYRVRARRRGLLRDTVGVSHHLVGSCKMGPATDPGVAVGPDLRVRGADRLDRLYLDHAPLSYQAIRMPPS
ncbi:GMC oxidoreductase [Mesorhizobium sp. M0830]|uniref:GMC oxidoreductase n=1 Tax=Mesorhizobium sp. M0830 TaxID=2957008 RepID=UPI00333CD952